MDPASWWPGHVLNVNQEIRTFNFVARLDVDALSFTVSGINLLDLDLRVVSVPRNRFCTVFNISVGKLDDVINSLMACNHF